MFKNTLVYLEIDENLELSAIKQTQDICNIPKWTVLNIIESKFTNSDLL
jgi:hypothetical protein